MQNENLLLDLELAIQLLVDIKEDKSFTEYSLDKGLKALRSIRDQVSNEPTKFFDTDFVLKIYNPDNLAIGTNRNNNGPRAA